MSQHATARPQTRPAPRRASSPAPRRLQVVAPPVGEGSGLFLALCVGLVIAGFVGVLVLNTAMAKGSYTMRDLQHRSDALTDTRDDLAHDLDAVSGPGPLARRATALGMVPAQTAAFLRLSDGRVIGVAQKATADTTFSVVTERAAPTGGTSPSATTKKSTTKKTTTKTSATTTSH